jgi:hydrogenase/urease accessory protein HupE
MRLATCLLALLGSALAVAVLGAPPAAAHVVATTGYSSVTQQGPQVSYELSLEYAILVKAVDLGPGAASAGDEESQQAAVQAGRPALEHYLDQRVVVSLDSAACEPSLQSVAIKKRDSVAYAQLTLLFACPGSVGVFGLHYGVFADSEAVAEDHSNVVEYHFAEAAGRTLFDRSHDDLEIGHSSILGAAGQYLLMGVEHILGGLDHVLFVVALVLGSAGLRNLVQVTSTFTLAHSITLITTLLGGVQVPAAIVEPLIALSIAFVALENLLGSTHRRLPVVFVFGLLHGLGFAGSLRITDGASWDLAASLLSFNVGIELGQAVLLVAVFPLVLLIRRSRFSAHITSGVTAVVAAFGLFWFVERFLLA